MLVKILWNVTQPILFLLLNPFYSCYWTHFILVTEPIMYILVTEPIIFLLLNSLYSCYWIHYILVTELIIFLLLNPLYSWNWIHYILVTEPIIFLLLNPLYSCYWTHYILVTETMNTSLASEIIWDNEGQSDVIFVINLQRLYSYLRWIINIFGYIILWSNCTKYMNLTQGQIAKTYIQINISLTKNRANFQKLKGYTKKVINLFHNKLKIFICFLYKWTEKKYLVMQSRSKKDKNR